MDKIDLNEVAEELNRTNAWATLAGFIAGAVTIAMLAGITKEQVYALIDEGYQGVRPSDDAN